jgi:hypothetical protein
MNIVDASNSNSSCFGLAKIINILRFRQTNVSESKNFATVVVFWYESGISKVVEPGKEGVSF